MAKSPISRIKKWRAAAKGRGIRTGMSKYVRRFGLRNKMPNKFVFKRAGQEQTVMNTGPGTVALTNTGITGWALSSTSADANGLYQFGGAFQGQLNSVQAYTDFVAMFDRYKISGIKVRFIPLTTQATVGSSIPMLAYCIDLDDASVPASYAEINQKYNVHKKRLDKPCSIYIKPRIAQSIYSGLTSGYAIGNKNTYIDCNDTGVPYYGLKFWFRDVALGATTTDTVVRIETTYYLSMKDSQ